jgi:hypothetical protein
MSKLKDIPNSSVDMKAPVLTRCPHCAKPNPVVEALTMGESADSVMVGFVPQCCKKLLGCQMIAKAPEVPLIN